MSSAPTDENRKLCPELKIGQSCIVVETYIDGNFKRELHEHVPRSQLSANNRLSLLRGLVVRFSCPADLQVQSIVRAHLRTKGRPAVVGPLQVHTGNPEPGVVRHFCGLKTVAWVDEIVAPWEFRKARERG